MRSSVFGIVGILALLLMAAMFAGGVVLIIFSRRRGAGHPACGQCGYDLTATLKTESARCPECGMDLAEAGVIPAGGPKKRSTPMLVMGILLLLVCVTCIGLTFFGMLAPSTRRATVTVPAPAPTPAQPDAPPAPESP